MKRRFLKVLFSLALGLGLLEGLCSGLAYVKYGTLDVGRLNELDTGNTYVTDNREGYLATLLPDPYLANRHNSNLRGVNNIGMAGPDFPLVKDETKYTVLLLGGSIAAQLGVTGELDKALGTIDGKPVIVLDGGGGGWHQPQQAIMMLLYGELADAVVTLDGFNERHRFGAGNRKRLEYEGGQLATVNPAIDGGFDRLGAAWQTNKLRQFSLSHNSRALYFATKALRRGIESSAVDVPPSSVYMLPADWSDDQCNTFNLAQYRKYMHSIDVLAAMHGQRVAHFVQPCPAIGKTLTDEEKRVVGPLDYIAGYQWLNDELVKDGAISLLDCYAGTKDTVYGDRVHCQGPGYRIMAERIAAELVRLWKVDDSTAGLP